DHRDAHHPGLAVEGDFQLRHHAEAGTGGATPVGADAVLNIADITAHLLLAGGGIGERLLGGESAGQLLFAAHTLLTLPLGLLAFELLLAFALGFGLGLFLALLLFLPLLLGFRLDLGFLLAAHLLLAGLLLSDRLLALLFLLALRLLALAFALGGIVLRRRGWRRPGLRLRLGFGLGLGGDRRHHQQLGLDVLGSHHLAGLFGGRPADGDERHQGAVEQHTGDDRPGITGGSAFHRRPGTTISCRSAAR